MNMQKLMKQAQQMQKEMQKAQEDVESLIVDASAGGGMVQVKISGKKEVVELTIDPEAVSADDVEMLSDMIRAAINEGFRKLKQLEEDKLGSVTKGMQMPGML